MQKLFNFHRNIDGSDSYSPNDFYISVHCSKLRENFGLRSQLRKYERDVLCQHRCV